MTSSFWMINPYFFRKLWSKWVKLVFSNQAFQKGGHLGVFCRSKIPRWHPAKCQQQQTLWVLIGMPWKLRKMKEGGNGGGEDEVDLCTRSWLGDTWWWKHVIYYLKKWAGIRATYTPIFLHVNMEELIWYQYTLIPQELVDHLIYVYPCIPVYIHVTSCMFKIWICINIFLDHPGLWCLIIIRDKVGSLRVSPKKPKKMPVFLIRRCCMFFVDFWNGMMVL